MNKNDIRTLVGIIITAVVFAFLMRHVIPFVFGLFTWVGLIWTALLVALEITGFILKLKEKRNVNNRLQSGDKE